MTIPVLQNTSRLANLLSQPHSIPASLSASGPTIRRVVRIMPQLGDVIVSPALVDTYAALNIIGIALLTLLTITFLIAPRKKLHRDPTLINAFLVLIWVGVWNIVYWAAVGTDIGVWESAQRPKRRLCEVQSYVLAGSQPAQAATVFALTFRLWISTIELSVPWFSRFKSRFMLVALLALPHVLYVAFIPWMVVHQRMHQKELSPTPFYCTSLDFDTRWAHQGIALVFSLVSLLVEMHLIYLVTRHFRQTTRAGQRANDGLSRSIGVDTQHLDLTPERSIHRSFFIRVGTFIAFTLVMLAATLYQAFTSAQLDPDADMLFACVAPLAFFCFASQPDVLRTWGVPTSIAEWKRVGRQRPAVVRKDSGETIRLTGDLGWADFLGSTSPDTIYSIDSRLSEMEEKERMRSGGKSASGSRSRGSVGSVVAELAPWGDHLVRLDTVSEEERSRNSRSASLVVTLSKDGRRVSSERSGRGGASAEGSDSKRQEREQVDEVDRVV